MDEEARRASERIARDLLEAGLRPGGVVLVHSSLSSMGYVPGGPETVIQGFLKALGPEGTLLMPALSYETVHAQNPVFDLLRTPSNVGAIPEYFRTRPGTLRSIHPTHSVCGVGPRAEELLGEHQLDETPCGEHSPFRKLRDIGGQIVFLGCGMKPNTSMHAVEEVAHPPYLFGSLITYRIILPGGKEMKMRSWRHDHGRRGWRQRYDRLEPLLKKGCELHIGRVLEATVQIVEARPMWERALAAFEKDVFYFVERIESKQ